MSQHDTSQVTLLLHEASAGSQTAPEELLPLIYAELRRLANHMLQGERPGQTIQATGLVHEAFISLTGSDKHAWENRRHFFNAAARSMRHILIDRARSKKRIKRGGDAQRADIDAIDIPILQEYETEQAEAIGVALDKLEKRDPRACEIVHCRFFAGLNIQETADLMNISPATVKTDWAFARQWLRREIDGTPHDEGVSTP